MQDTKKCSGPCGKVKPLEEFNKHKNGKLGRQDQCRQCNKKYYLDNKDKRKQYNENNRDKRKQYSLNNRDKINQYLKDSRIRNKKYVWDIKCHSNCCICKMNIPECLEFDHVDPKTKFKSVSKLVYGAANLNILQKEIDKCIIMCANCHREKHFTNVIPKGKKDLYVRELKERSECKACKKKGVACLVFHHRDPSTKIFELGQAGRKEYTMQMVEDEIKKCDILCENCHRKLHYKLKWRKDYVS